jgi:hypothetical protein
VTNKVHHLEIEKVEGSKGGTVGITAAATNEEQSRTLIFTPRRLFSEGSEPAMGFSREKPRIILIQPCYL